MDRLADTEMKLYKTLSSLQGTMEEKGEQIKKLGIFAEYMRLHEEYANESHDNLEALKRGLFLIWFSMTEPPIYTGINDLDKVSEDTIIKNLIQRLKENKSDYELNWMLNYYKDWEYVFERFEENSELNSLMKRNIEMPNSIDREAMNKRGRMGNYWNSLKITPEKKNLPDD